MRHRPLWGTSHLGALGLLLLVATSIEAQVPADSLARFHLTGQVVDGSTNRPIIAAVIKVPELGLVAYSNREGNFQFPDFPPGRWEFVIEQLGYHTREEAAEVVEGNTLFIRMRPDPVALAGFRVQSRSQKLISERSRKIPYRVNTIPTEVFAESLRGDPAAEFRSHANTAILACNGNSEETLTPGCFWFRGGLVRIAVFVDEGRLLGGMQELTMHGAKDIYSMEWVPRMRMLRVYTRRFIDKLDHSRISLEPLVYP